MLLRANALCQLARPLSVARAVAGVRTPIVPAAGLRRAYSATAMDDPAPAPAARVAPAASSEATSTPPEDAVAPTSIDAPVFQAALHATAPRTDWTRAEIASIYHAPLLELAHAAGTVHRRFHSPGAVQMCTLINIKTGGCSEDCSYCAQSSRYATGLTATKLSPVETVLAAARVARDNGSTRFCMGAAWRDMRGRKSGLRNIKAMVAGVHALGLESCVTLGMLDDAQAAELKAAGLTAYNHNVDTSREHYPKVITTRSYDERLATIGHVRDAGIKVCTGGILGLGETAADHVGLLHTVATMPAHPESFPVNTLVPIQGTPLYGKTHIRFDAVLRTIAAARLIMPTTMIRIAAGRVEMAEEKQALCFLAGANAVFTGDKMLTTACSGWEEDLAMFNRWGLFPMKAHVEPKLREAVVC